MKRFCLSVTLGMLLSVGLPASSAPPKDDKPTYINADGADVLKDLKDITVVVERLPKEFLTPSLTPDGIKADVELKLKVAGLHVVPTAEAQQTHPPVLYVNVNGFKAINGLFVYNITLALQEDVSPLRTKNIVVTGATVWQRAFVGATGELNLSAVRSDVKDDMDVFTNDFQAGNPKH